MVWKRESWHQIEIGWRYALKIKSNKRPLARVLGGVFQRKRPGPKHVSVLDIQVSKVFVHPIRNRAATCALYPFGESSVASRTRDRSPAILDQTVTNAAVFLKDRR